MIKYLNIVLILSTFLLTLNASKLPSNYYKLPLAKQKKEFIKFFKEKIEKENLKILEERKFILSLNKTTNLNPNSKKYKKLQKLQKKYKIPSIYNYRKYLVRIDIIPISMALAQAATESGWGKSRFFKKANNIFGHWTYNPKKGMVPRKRAKGKKHLIKIFPSLQDSISAYMLNLNKTSAYFKFRLQRQKLRKNKQFINGMKLSSTMDGYSGIGYKYVKILKSIIRQNNLINLDKNFHKKYKI